MPTLTIRNLPDDVHARLRAGAAASHVSVEGFVRRTLGEVMDGTRETSGMSQPGFGEAPQPFIHAVADASSGPSPELWGALKGSVRFASGVDLTAPLDEAWSAED